MRIASRPDDVGTVVANLRQFCAEAGHQFWAADVSIPELVVPNPILMHAHVTDFYLLGLAGHKGGKLATLDHRIPVAAVQGSAKAIWVIPT